MWKTLTENSSECIHRLGWSTILQLVLRRCFGRISYESVQIRIIAMYFVGRFSYPMVTSTVANRSGNWCSARSYRCEHQWNWLLESFRFRRRPCVHSTHRSRHRAMHLLSEHRELADYRRGVHTFTPFVIPITIGISAHTEWDGGFAASFSPETI